MRDEPTTTQPTKPESTTAHEQPDESTTSPKAMLFWIAVPLLMLLAFAAFSELTGAK